MCTWFSRFQKGNQHRGAHRPTQRGARLRHGTPASPRMPHCGWSRSGCPARQGRPPLAPPPRTGPNRCPASSGRGTKGTAGWGVGTPKPATVGCAGLTVCPTGLLLSIPPDGTERYSTSPGASIGVGRVAGHGCGASWSVRVVRCRSTLSWALRLFPGLCSPFPARGWPVHFGPVQADRARFRHAWRPVPALPVHSRAVAAALWRCGPSPVPVGPFRPSPTLLWLETGEIAGNGLVLIHPRA